jgi:hypothetical protein
MKRTIVLLAVALAIPTSVAFAKGPGTHHGRGKRGHNAEYILEGTLSSYTAFDQATSTNGSITIDVKHAGFHGHKLKGQSLTFALDASSKVMFRHGSSLADSTATARGVIAFRAPRRINGDLATTLPGLATRIHVVVLKNLTA